MRTPVLLTLVLSAAPFAMADVSVGASLEEVKAELGSPNGQVRLGERHLLYYERGSVELVDQRVIAVELRTPEEHAALEAREERLRAEQEARRAELIAEGTELRDRKLADEAFRASPVAYQVSFWEDFARRYPGVSCAEPLSIARLKLHDQREEKNRKAEEVRRLAEIEERLAAAEREPVYYRVRSYPSYRGHRDHYNEFALWPVAYTYYDSPLPAYTTPTTPLINPFVRDPAQPPRRDYVRPGAGRENDGDGDRAGHRDWRGSDRGPGYRRGRL